MTPQDEALELTVDFWNKFLEIESLHPCDKQEVCHHLHCIQNLLYAHKYKIEVPNNNMLK